MTLDKKQNEAEPKAKNLIIEELSNELTHNKLKLIFKKTKLSTLMLALFLLTFSTIQWTLFSKLSNRMATLERLGHHLLQKELEYENKIFEINEILLTYLSSTRELYPSNEIIVPLDEKKRVDALR